jgi:transposase
MAEDISNLKDRLVIGLARGGRRRRFDRQAKRELVQACLQPGVSVARMALDHGLNANLLRRWISDYAREHRGDVARSPAIENATPAFVPVVQIGGAQMCEVRQAPARVDTAQAAPRPPYPSRLVAELPNGVTLKLESNGHDATLVSAMIETLVRCHVPTRC